MGKGVFKYRIGEAADDPGWFGAFYGSDNWAKFRGTQAQLAQALGVSPEEIYDMNVVESTVIPHTPALANEPGSSWD